LEVAVGHERVGVLPKTKQWREIVASIEGLASSEEEVADIVQKTVGHLRSRFRFLHQDDGVKAAFKFLVLLAISSRSSSPQKSLAEYGVELPPAPNLLTLSKALHKSIAGQQQSLEYGQMARVAATKAITEWYLRHKSTQQDLFEKSEIFFQAWRKAGSGAGFCELSRLFFARFTEFYLKYFLERHASSALTTLNERHEFSRNLEEYIASISHHAFETARITQSFSAGWFNKNSKEGVPTNQSIETFLAVAFGKIRDELQREKM
jgi:hypothetical protein